jgi:general secretion pathway protein C
MAGSSNQRWSRTVLLVYLVAGGFFLAHSINAVIADTLYLQPVTPLNPVPRENVASVAHPSSLLADTVRMSGLFARPTVPPDLTRHGIETDAPVRGSLGLAGKIRLIGVVMSDQRGMFAIIEELPSKRQGLYRLQDHIPDSGELSEIRRDAIVVRSGDVEELLELGLAERPRVPPTGSPSALVPGVPLRKVVDRREVDQALSDLPKLLTQARAVPYMANGAISGFRIDYIAPSSFYEKIGIQYGDILQRVNGVDVRDPSTMLNLFQQLKNERTVRLDLVRNNQKTTMTYDLR